MLWRADGHPKVTQVLLAKWMARVQRLAGLKAFLSYALARPEVRVVAAEDVLAWMVRNSAER